MLGDTIFSPEIFALITVRRKINRKKGGLRLIEMPNKCKRIDKNVIYVLETIENILNYACV